MFYSFLCVGFIYILLKLFLNILRFGMLAWMALENVCYPVFVANIYIIVYKLSSHRRWWVFLDFIPNQSYYPWIYLNIYSFFSPYCTASVSSSILNRNCENWISFPCCQGKPFLHSPYNMMLLALAFLWILFSSWAHSLLFLFC